jgi:hypothetical protein
VSGLSAAGFYYTTTLRPLAHVLGPWVLLAAIVAARQPPARAVIRCVLLLLTAVLAFYLGKQLLYGIRYGSGYLLDLGQITLWCLLAAAGGGLLGLAFHSLGRSGWLGAFATAAAVGILVADGARRATHYRSGTALLIVFTVAAVVTVLFLSDRSSRQLARLAALVGPLTVLGYLLVGAPDFFERSSLTLRFCPPAAPETHPAPLAFSGQTCHPSVRLSHGIMLHRPV